MRRVVALTVLAGWAVLVAPVSSQSKKDFNDALKYFKSKKSTDRAFAMSVFGLMKGKAVGASKQVVEGLIDSSPEVRRAAGLAMPKVNPTIAGPVMTLVQSKDYKKQMTALKQLAKLGDKALPTTPALLTFLKKAKPNDKAAVVQTIATVGAKDPQTSNLMTTMALNDPDPNVQKAAADSLTKLPGGKQKVGVFLDTLNKRTSDKQHIAAIRALTVLGKGDANVKKKLTSLAKSSPSAAVRKEAKTALTNLEKKK